MTEPVQFQTKPAHETSAILYDGSQESIDALVAWLNPHYGDGNEVEFYTTPMGVLVLHLGGNPLLQVQPDQYVYAGPLIEGFKVASRTAFEMLYAPAPNGA